MATMTETALPTAAVAVDTQADRVADSLAVVPSLKAEQRRAVQRFLRSAGRSAVKWPGRAWGAVDFVIAAVSFLAAHLLSPKFSFDLVSPAAVATGAILFASSLLLFSYVVGTYDRHNFIVISRMVGRTCATNAMAFGVTTLTFAWLGYVHIGRLIVVETLLLSAGGTFACRMVARELARVAKIRLVLIGSRRRFRPLAAQIRRLHAAFYERPIYVASMTMIDDATSDNGRGAFELLKEFDPDEIVIMDDDPALFAVLRDSPRILRSGCAIFSHSAYYERLLREVPIESIDQRGVLGSGFNFGSLHTGLAKRPIDIVLAAVGLVLAAPLMLLCCVLVKATSRGPIIYSQVRVGRYGRPFRIYKFRTMRTDAEANGAVWAVTGD